MSQHLHLDPFAGIAGDMFIGACVDLGVSLDDLAAALAPLAFDRPYELSAEPTMRQGIAGIDFRVIVDDPALGADDHHHHHHHTHYHDIVAMVDALDAGARAKQRARAIVDKLAAAEAAVHGIAVERVHFHEVGAVDSIVDMLGAAVALELLDVGTLSSGPLPIGSGFVRCAHGMMPLPAPATAELLKDVSTVGVDRQVETVTPTGAAIVAALADEVGPQPAMTIGAVGYGAGDRDDPDTPNLLRVMIGQRDG
ncbi:MAG: hypothetical protein CMJ49_01305 [Planctomycetaceae bacterium]|nr:hypothetical protein [Planctomycetaceae bacterium]